jgi:hypothetical protein
MEGSELTAKLATDLSGVLVAIDPRVAGVPLQSWHAPKGEQQILLRLTKGPATTDQLHDEFGCPSDEDVIRAKLRRLKAARLVDQRRNYPKSPAPGVRRQQVGQLPATWFLFEAGVHEKAGQQFEDSSAMNALPPGKRAMLNQVDWDELEVNQHEAWRLAELLARYDLDPTATAQSIAKALPADVTTVRRWRRACIRKRLLKQRVRKTKFGKRVPVEAFDVQWLQIEKRRNAEFAGRTLAPQRAPEPLSRSSPKVDLRTRDELRWCEALTHEDVNLSPHEWAAFNALWAAQGTRSFTTYEKMAALLGRATRRAIDRVMPGFEREKLVTVKLHAGGKDGRESEVVFKADKIKLAAAAKGAAESPRQVVHAATESVRDYNATPKVVTALERVQVPSGTFGQESKWDDLREFAASYRVQHADCSYREILFAYQKAFPDKPVPLGRDGKPSVDGARAAILRKTKPR